MKLKNLLHPILIRIVPVIGSAYSLIMGHTTQVKIIARQGGPDTKQKIFASPEGIIYSCWHSRFFYFSYFGRGKRVVVMISASKDGEFITKTIERMRLFAVRGSSSNRGQEALYELAQFVKQNRNTLMIPDGPRGPKCVLKPGVIRLAQITGRPIVPITFSSTRGIFFPSWDNFFLPLPFGKAIVVTGEPVYVPADITPEQFEQKRLQLEKSMNEVLEEADRYCRRNPGKEMLTFLRKKK